LVATWPERLALWPCVLSWALESHWDRILARLYVLVHCRNYVDELADTVLVRWQVATLKPVREAASWDLLGGVGVDNLGKYSPEERTLARLGGHVSEDMADLVGTLAGAMGSLGPDQRVAGDMLAFVEDHILGVSSLEVS
jgi:hypothetical protein